MSEWEDFDWPDLDRELTFRQLLYDTRPENLLSVAIEYAERHNIEGFFPFPRNNESHTAMIERWVLEAELAQQKHLAEKGLAAETAKAARLEKRWEGHPDRMNRAVECVKLRVENNDVPPGWKHMDLVNAAIKEDKQRNPASPPLGRAELNSRVKALLREKGRPDLIRGGDGTKKR